MRAINEVYSDKILEVDNFYSCGRVRVRKSNTEQFYAIHLLYAPPVNRGNVCLLEDFPRVNGIEIKLNVNEKIKSIVDPVKNESVSFTQNGNIVSLTVDNLQLHKLLIINY